LLAKNPAQRESKILIERFGLGTKQTCLSASLNLLNNIPLFPLLRGWNNGIIVDIQMYTDKWWNINICFRVSTPLGRGNFETDLYISLGLYQ